MNYRHLILRLRDAARDNYIEAGISTSRWAASLRDKGELLDDAADAIQQLSDKRFAEYDPTKPLPPGYQ